MKLRPRRNTKDLTPAQRLLYASEKQLNFRTIAKICATRSHYVLGIADLATAETHFELAQLGQFAELAYSVIEPDFVFEHLDVLMKEKFPLEGYDALVGAKLVSSFVGDTAKLPGYVAYRPETKQLVVAFSGTATLGQSVLDLRFRKHKHPAGQGCKVHNGFWRLYKGCRPQALAGIRDGLQQHEVLEVVITGHSLGGALASLLALDLVTAPSLQSLLPPNVGLKIVGYGSPRVGNPKLVQVWREALAAQREKGRQVQEYLVKAYNDGKCRLTEYMDLFSRVWQRAKVFPRCRLLTSASAILRRGRCISSTAGCFTYQSRRTSTAYSKWRRRQRGGPSFPSIPAEVTTTTAAEISKGSGAAWSGLRT